MTDRGDDGFEPHLGDPWHPAWDADDEPSPDESAPTEPAPTEPAPTEPKKPKKPKKGLFRRRREEDPAPEEADQPEESDADLDPEPSEPVADEPPADDARAESPPSATDAPLPAWLSEVEGESQVDTTLEIELPSWVGGATAGADGVDGEFPDQVFDDDLDEEEDDLAGDSEETIDPVEEPVPSEFAEDPVELPDDLAAVLEALGDDGDAVEVLGGDELADEVDAEEIDEIPDLESLSALAGGLKDPSPEEAALRSEYGVAGPEAFDALKDLDESADLDDWHQFAGATGDAPRDPAPEVEPAAVEPEEAPVEDSRRGIWPFRRKGAVADEPAEEIIAEEPADWDDDGTAIPSEWFAQVDEDTVTTPPADLPETEWPEVDPAAAALPPAAPEGVVPDGWVDEVVDEPPAPEVVVPDQPGVPEVDGGWVDQVEDGPPSPEAAVSGGPVVPDGWVDEVEQEPAAPEVVVPDQPGVPEVDGGFGDEVGEEPSSPEGAVADVPVLPDGWGDEVGEEPSSSEGAVADVPVLPDGWGDEVGEEPASQEGAVADVPVLPDGWGDEAEVEPSSSEAAVPDVPVLPHGWGDEVGEEPAAEPPVGTQPMPSLFDDRSAQETQEFDPIAEGVGVTPPDLTPADEFEAPLGFDEGAAEAGSDLDDDLEEEGYEDRWVTGPIELGGEYEDAADEPGEYGSMDELSDDAYQTSTTVEHRGLAEEILRSGDDEHEWQAMAAAMPGVESGVVGFDDVADLGDDEEYLDTRVRSDLGTRILTGGVLAGFFLGSLWVAPEALAGFIGLMLLLGLGEFYSTVRRIGFRPLALFGFMGALALLSTVWFHGPVAIAAALVITAVVTFFVYAFSPLRRDALTNGGLTVLGLTWVVGSAAFSYPILASEDYRVLVLALVAVTAAMDIGAYAVGRAWGTRSLAPILSPNKSIEGLVGGIGLCMLAGAAVGNFLEPFDLMSGIGLGIVVVFTAPLGDLAESMFKRSLGVKDMGSILPGHGGILDRIDALLFVIPAAWAFYQIIGLLG